MSDADIPDRVAPAIRWAIAGIACFVFFLIAIEKFNDGKLLLGWLNFAAFSVTFFVAVKWKRLSSAVSKRRKQVALTLVVIGVIVLVWGVYLLASQPTPVAASEETSAAIPTSLTLQFYGDHRIPTMVGQSENVYYWYAVYSPSLSLSFMDEHGNKITPPGGSPSAGPSWNVFVVLEKPTKRRQIVISFSNPDRMGPAQIMGETDRSFVFISNGEVPAGVLKLSADI